MKKIIDKIIGQLGYVIVKKTKRVEYADWDDPQRSHMISEQHQTILFEELASIIHSFSKDNFFNFQLNQQETFNIVQEFFKVYANREFVNNSGGSGFHNSLWLFFYIKAFNPGLIIESGVWKGLGTYILEKASLVANIHCFDLSFRHLTYKSKAVSYHEYDWSKFDFGKVGAEKSICFFDCHVNHAKRIIESHEKGFKHLIFDDNPPIHKLYAFGLPGLPTVDMILNTQLKDGEEIQWKWNNQIKSFTVNKVEIEKAKALIESTATFPDVCSPTRYSTKLGSHAFLTYVKLK